MNGSQKKDIAVCCLQKTYIRFNDINLMKEFCGNSYNMG